MVIGAGRLNRRISLLTQTTAQDALGQPFQTWAVAYLCWASIDIQGSQLLYSTAEFMDKVAYRITIRWTSSVLFSASQRVSYTNSRTGITHLYEIQAVLNDRSANTQISLMCYELKGKE